jgi:uncharacterized OsmC-like protein
MLLSMIGRAFDENCRSIVDQSFRAQSRGKNRRSQAINSYCPKSAGRGSSINGGELLFAALATCFCNDLYREAAKRNIAVQEVEIEVTGTFGNPGEPARDISYRVQVHADAPKATIDDLIRARDAVTEIQNTVRAGCSVKLIMGD